MSLYQLSVRLSNIQSIVSLFQHHVTITTPQPTITPVSIIDGCISIDFQNHQVHSYSIQMTSDITSANFTNCCINGSYTIYISTNSGPHVMNRFIGEGIKTNMSGNICISNDFIINIRFNGYIYYLELTNYV